jgi:hypothetical protein
MPIGKKFGTNAVKQVLAITYFTSVLNNIQTLKGSRLISGDNLIFEKKYDYRKRIIRESISDRVG